MNYRKKRRFSYHIFIWILFLFSSNSDSFAQDDLDVLRNKWLQFSDAQNTLYHHLTSQAYAFLGKRKNEVAAISDLQGWKNRQKYVNETLMTIVGPFPEKSPLNAKVLRTIEKDGYRVEHIVFESQPRFYVTSSLFIPSSLKKNQRAPTIIYCSGHSVEGYRSAVYQHVIINLVKKGFIVFAFDPVGQGERLEYFDPKAGKSIVGGPTTEHSYPGAQAFITGSSQARYMIWDGIRAVDYLVSRKEVDPSRIGITGRSGGGTQSAYIAAFDDRIYAVAPENYITNFTRLLQTIGPQDAEQNLPSQIYYGIDHPDLLEVRAPKPALMITTTRDMFSIQGSRETEQEVALIYKSYGAPENFSRIEDDDVHASTKKNRVAMYSFFRKHLNNPGTIEDEEVTRLTTDEIRVTPTGQVSTSFQGETVFSLNSAETGNQLVRIEASRKNMEMHLNEVKRISQKLAGYIPPAEVAVPVFTGRIQKADFAIEKYFIKGEGEYVVPYLLFRPSVSNGKVLIYIHPQGKAAEAGPGKEIEWFVSNGVTVLAPDLPGIGEMGPGILRGDANIEGTSHNIWYASILINRSLTGIRAGDVVRLIKVMQAEEGVEEIIGFARKEFAPVMLYAAAFEPSIKRVALIDPLSSYNSVVMNRSYKSSFITGAVPGSLEYYDLPDLMASLAPARLLIAGMTDGNGKYQGNETVTELLKPVRDSYKMRNATGELIIFAGDNITMLNSIFLQWLK